MALTAMHAEAVPYDATAMRWVLPDGLPACGRLVGAPGRLGELVTAGGPIVRAVAERRALWTWLARPAWDVYGVEIRQAVFVAAGRPAEWQIEPDADEVLELVATDVINRTLKAFIASHGGEIVLVRASENTVDVEMKGACARCAAAGGTLHGRIEREISDRTGSRVTVNAIGVGRRRIPHLNLPAFGAGPTPPCR